MEEEPKCNYCEDTGYIGSPFELNCIPCTDCDIWWNKVKVSETTE